MVYAALVTGGAVTAELTGSFHSINSFGLRLNMVTKAMAGPWNIKKRPEHVAREEDWRPVRNKLKEHNEKRNSLAHGAVICPEPSTNGLPYALPVWVPFYQDHAYRAWKFLRADRERGRFEELSASDIAERRSTFIESQRLLSEFYHSHFANRSE